MTIQTISMIVALLLVLVALYFTQQALKKVQDLEKRLDRYDQQWADQESLLKNVESRMEGQEDRKNRQQIFLTRQYDMLDELLDRLSDLEYKIINMSRQAPQTVVEAENALYELDAFKRDQAMYLDETSDQLTSEFTAQADLILGKFKNEAPVKKQEVLALQDIRADFLTYVMEEYTYRQ